MGNSDRLDSLSVYSESSSVLVLIGSHMSAIFMVDITAMCSAASPHCCRNPPKEILITYYDIWEFLKMINLSFDSVLS